MSIKKLFILLLGLVSVIGLFAIGYRLAFGLRVSNLSSNVPWGMWVAWYAYFVGLATGTFLLSTLVYVFGIKRLAGLGRSLLLISLLSLLTALTFIWLDLGHPFRFWHVFVSPQLSSVLEWEIWFYTLFVIFLFMELWFLMRCDLAQLALQETGKKRLFYKLFSLGWHCPQTEAELKTCHLVSLRRVKLFSLLAILPCLAGGTGAIFSVLASKPYWFSAILPLIFLVSAITAGIASITFLFAFFFRKESNYWEQLVFLRRLLLVFVVFDFFLFLLEYLVGLYGEVPGHIEVYYQIMFGPFPYVFWLGQIGLAGLVPLLLLAVPKFKNTPCWVGIAALSTAVGLVAVRLNLIVPAFIIPMLKGLETAYQDSRLSYFYFPSFWEWASSLGLIAFFGLLFIALFNFLPLKKSDL